MTVTFNAQTLIGCLCLYVSSTISSAAGVGGGSLNVPILVNFFGLSFHKATVLSLCTLLGNYLLQVMVNIERRHPTMAKKPLIYWDAVLILLPAELGGSNLGVILSAMFPDTLSYILALMVLMIAGTFTLSKAMNLFEDESQLLENRIVFDDTRPLLRQNEEEEQDRLPGTVTLTGNANNLSSGRNNPANMPLLPSYCVTCCNLYHKDKKHDDTDVLPPLSLSKLVVQVVLGVWLFYVVCYICMKLFTPCSAVYYIFLSMIYLLLVVEVVWGLNYLVAEQRKDPDSIAEGDIAWGSSAYYLAPIVFCIGIITALLGIGGGELLGPLLLKMQVLPLVSSSTTSFMSLLNTSSSIAHYITLNEVDYEYAFLVFVMGALGGGTGRVSSLLIARYYGRVSLIVFALFIIIALSFAVYIFYLFEDDSDITFSSLC